MSYRQIYEILDQDHPERFNDLISVLSNPSTSNEQRSESESLFNSCKQTDPNTVVDKLVNLLEHSVDIDVRKMSATLLGNIFEKSKSTQLRVVDKLVNLLEHSVDIDVRKMSAILLGNIFQKFKSTQPRVVDKLVNLLEHSLHIDVRKMSAILLGNIFEKSNSKSQSRVKDCLLDCVVKEENRPIIEVLGDTISKLAPDEKVANTLLERLASDNTSVQECTLLIFPQLERYLFDSKVLSMLYMKRLHDDFMNCLGNLGSANVRIAALIAATSFIQWLISDRWQDLLPGMMQSLVEVLNGGDEAMKQKALVLLIKLAETKPSFFTKRLVEVLWSMLQIADTESLEEGTRNLAITFVITLVEVSNQGPADIRVRAMSAVLLGNLFKKCHPMSESTYSRVKGYLLACVVKEENKPIIEILGYPISMLAPDKDFANILLNHVATLQESGILIFPHVVQYVMASNVPFTIRLRHVFKNRLGNVGSANVRIAVLIAATSFIQCLMSSSDGDWFQGLLPGMMQCLDEGGDEAMTQKALVLLIELAEMEPSFFNRQLEEVVWSMSQIAEAENLEEGTRRLAKKFVITLEAHDVSALVNISDNFPPDTSMPDMLEIVGNLRQFRLQEGIASDQTRTPAIEKLLEQFREKLPPKTWASTWSSLRLESILAHKEN